MRETRWAERRWQANRRASWNLEEGGSLTVIAAARLDTGGRMAEVMFKRTGSSEYDTLDIGVRIGVVPLPPSALLLGTGLAGLLALRGWRRRRA